MKAAPFDYFAPESLDEALRILEDIGDDAKVLAGGQSLVPLLALRLSTPIAVVDINRIVGLNRITSGPDGLRVGALVRHAEAERSPIVAELCPLLAEAMPFIGHHAIRGRGTLVGSIAHGDPAAELPAVALALDAVMTAASTRGTRSIPAREFFEGFLTTALQPAEVLTDVLFPPTRPRTGTAWLEVSRRHGDFALVGVACVLSLDDAGRIGEARIALSGVDGTPVRAGDAETNLVGAEPAPEVFRAAGASAAGLVGVSDLHGTAGYRSRLVATLVRRGLAAATERARGNQ